MCRLRGAANDVTSASDLGWRRDVSDLPSHRKGKRGRIRWMKIVRVVRKGERNGKRKKDVG